MYCERNQIDGHLPLNIPSVNGQRFYQFKMRNIHYDEGNRHQEG